MMLYWVNDLTGEVKALEDGCHPGEGWFEISPADYEANHHSRPVDLCVGCGKRYAAPGSNTCWMCIDWATSR